MRSKAINIMLVDDHEVVLSGVTRLLSNEAKYRIIGTAKSKDETREILNTNPVDVAIIDLSLPEFEGIDLQNIITKNSPHTKTIVFSMHDSEWVICKLLSNGVSGYVSKTSDFQELKTAIDEVMAGNPYFCSKTKEKYYSLFEIQDASGKDLTRREKDIIRLIFQEFKTSQIAKKLNISQNTVESHRKNIMQKLHTSNSVGIIKKAIERGIITVYK
jgi:DNA-binding NarL/FixJ family response regulator